MTSTADHRRFVSMPPPRFLDEVRAQVDVSGRPEAIPALLHQPIRKAEPFLIVGPVSIPRGRRPAGDMAPCPMCQPNKFLEGKLVYFPALEAAAVIGHCCAASETRREAEREYQARESARLATDRLLEQLPQLGTSNEKLNALASLVHAAQCAFDHMKKNGGAFRQALRRATKGDANLSVTEVLGSTIAGGPSGLRTAGSTLETRDISFGALAGRALIAEKCTLVEDWERCRELLNEFPPFPDDDAVLDYVVRLDAQGRLHSADGELSGALALLLEMSARVAEMRSFFAAANLERINRWAQHRDSPLWMRASLGPHGAEGKQLFEIKGRDHRRVGVLIEAAFWDQMSL